MLITLTMRLYCIAAFKPFFVHQKFSKTVLNVYKNGSYRLWDDAEGIKSLPVIGKATGNLLNLAADLLRIQGIVCLLVHSILPFRLFILLINDRTKQYIAPGRI